MAALLSGVLGLRRDPRLSKLPPYSSALCIIIGVAWLLLLPSNEYSRQTYVSENALLPGQVHTYFGGSEHNVFRAYRQEVARLAEQPDQDRYQGLFDILKSNGLKAGIQDYRYESAGQVRTGRNVYAVLQGPRADATEAMVLMAGWRNMDKVVNYSGVALVLTLARYFKRWSLWSKDIIILIPSDSTFGPQAWVDAYHDKHDPKFVSSLEIKSGALQAAVAIDYPAGPWGHRFDKSHVVYDGINGQLPNLDSLNTAISVASGQMGIGCSIQRMFNTQDRYQDRSETMFRGMISQAWGHASGPHSSFIPYHIDAITSQTVGDGWHDEMSLGRSVEGLFRSSNNLLEHLHQSFFFYSSMNANRFVSIGTYLPSAMSVAGNFTITAISLWIQSGRPTTPVPNPASSEKEKEEPDMTLVKEGDSVAVVPTKTFSVAERDMFPPIAIVSSMHLAGLLLFYNFNNISGATKTSVLLPSMASTVMVPINAASALQRVFSVTKQHITSIHCFSSSFLGAALSTLATLNFSQSLVIGILAAPLSFIRPASGPGMKVLGGLLSVAFSPAVSSYAGSVALKVEPQTSLADAAWGWKVEGIWTGLMVWLLWWPAWACGTVVLMSGSSDK